MPQYRFECQACHKPFEISASMAEYASMQKLGGVPCPACGAAKAIRVFTAPNVVQGSSASNSGPCCPGGQCG